jgi:hypothetical protein
MDQRPRPVLGIALLVAIALAGWLVPWRYLASTAAQFVRAEADDRPAWVQADGRTFNVRLYPELFKVLGDRYGGDGKSTFAVPRIDEPDFLANERFGTVLLYRCIATRDLADYSPAGTLAWCTRQAFR